MEGGETASFWHSIPLAASHGAYSFVTEIPMGTSAKISVESMTGRVDAAATTLCVESHLANVG